MWWIPLAAAGISSAGNLLDTAQNNKMSSQQMAQQHAYNQQLMSQQYQQNVNMWNMQNAYNSPAEQMKRYQEAGLNPNLIYNQQNTAGPISAVTPQKTEVPAKRSAWSSVMNDLASGLTQSFQQLATWNTDQRLKEQQIEANDLALAGARYDNAIKEWKATHQGEMWDVDKAYKSARTSWTVDSNSRANSLFPYQERIQAAAAERAENYVHTRMYVENEISVQKLKREKQGLLNDIENGHLTRQKRKESEARVRDIDSKIKQREEQIAQGWARLSESSERWHTQQDFKNRQQTWNEVKGLFDTAGKLNNAQDGSGIIGQIRGYYRRATGRYARDFEDILQAISGVNGARR